MGDMLQLPLVLLHRRDVGEQRHVILQNATGVAHRADGQQLGKYLSALASVPEFPAPIAGFFDGASPRRVELPALLRRVQQPLRVLAQGLFAAVAGDIGKGVIDLDDEPLRIGNDDAFAGMAENDGRQLQLSICHRLLDRQRSQPGFVFQQGHVRRRWRHGLAVVQRKSAQHLTLRRENRLRPARRQIGLLRQVAKFSPPWMVGNVFHNGGLSSERGGAAGAYPRPNGGAIQRLGIAVWQVGGGTVVQMLAVGIEHQNAAYGA